MNKKGFVLIETLVVTLFVLFIFTILYNSAVPLLAKYNELGYYDDLDTTYDLYHLRNLILKDSNYNSIKTKKYQKLQCSNLISNQICSNLFNILELDTNDEIVFLNMSYLNDLKNDANISYDIKNYLSYVDTTGNILILQKNGYVSYLNLSEKIYTYNDCFKTNRLPAGTLEITDYYMYDETSSDKLYRNELCTKDVQIPSSINGVTVTRIGDSAFASKGITSVVVPTTIKEIGKLAFANNYLDEIELPNVETIDDQAFYTEQGTNSYYGIETIRIGSQFTNAGVGIFSTYDYDMFASDGNVYIDLPCSTLETYANYPFLNINSSDNGNCNYHLYGNNELCYECRQESDHGIGGGNN